MLLFMLDAMTFNNILTSPLQARETFHTTRNFPYKKETNIQGVIHKGRQTMIDISRPPPPQLPVCSAIIEFHRN